jgi:hypothetical protein
MIFNVGLPRRFGAGALGSICYCYILIAHILLTFFDFLRDVNFQCIFITFRSLFLI